MDHQVKYLASIHQKEVSDFDETSENDYTFEIFFPVPGPVRNLEAYPMGSSAFYLIWKKPLQPNGILTGYNISYQEVKGMHVGPMLARVPQINDPNRLTAKLSGLKADTKYRIHIKATTAAGEGDGYVSDIIILLKTI